MGAQFSCIFSILLTLHKTNQFPSQKKKKSTLTVWVVAVRVPSLTFVQPISIVNDANLSKTTMSTSFDDGVADAAVEKPSGCTNMKTWAKQEKFQHSGPGSSSSKSF